MTDRDLLNLEHGAEQAIDTAFTHLRKATAQQVQAAESIPSALDEAMETLDSLGGTRRCETEEDMAALLQAINDCALHAQNLTGTGGPQHRYIKEACFELGQAARFLYYFRPEIEYAGLAVFPRPDARKQLKWIKKHSEKCTDILIGAGLSRGTGDVSLSRSLRRWLTG